jgi:hypothetical protein
MSIEEIIATSLAAARGVKIVDEVDYRLFCGDAKAILAALDAAGYAVVPKEASHDMALAGLAPCCLGFYQREGRALSEFSTEDLQRAWRSMVKFTR